MLFGNNLEYLFSNPSFQFSSHLRFKFCICFVSVGVTGVSAAGTECNSTG